MKDLKMTNEILDSLVRSGELSSYKYEEILESPDSEVRTTEQLELVFPSGKKLIIDTFCSGCLQNTSLFFGTPDEDGRIFRSRTL